MRFTSAGWLAAAAGAKRPSPKPALGVEVQAALRLVAAVAALVALAAGCHDPDDAGRAHIVSGLERALPDELLGPLASVAAEPLPADPLLRSPVLAARAAGLGPLEYRGDTRFSLTRAGVDPIEVRERVVIRVDADGQFDGERERSTEHGRHTRDVRKARWVGGELYLASDSGRWFQDHPMREGHLRWLHDATEAGPTLVSLVAPLCQRAGGDDTRAVTLRLRAGARPPVAPPEARDAEATWESWWQGVHRVDRAEVTAQFFSQRDAVERLELRVEATVERGQAQARLTVSHRHELVLLPEPPRLDAPAEVHEPRRRRVFELVRRVLGDELGSSR